MATIVNNPAAGESGSNGSGFLIGVIVLIIAVVVLLFYGLPYLRGSMGSSMPQVNVPGKIDVNVNQPGK